MSTVQFFEKYGWADFIWVESIGKCHHLNFGKNLGVSFMCCCFLGHAEENGISILDIDISKWRRQNIP